MPYQSWQNLTRINAHPRDAHIAFDEPTHTYYINGSSKGVISCTGFIHSFFGHFNPKEVLKKMRNNATKWAQSKYFGKTDDEIIAEWNANGKTASEAGTEMHLAIEQYLHGSPQLISDKIKSTKEWEYFMNFWNTYSKELEPYRSEWEVFTDSLEPLEGERKIKLAGSIDMVFRRKSDGKFVIYDWKRSKEITTDNKYDNGFPPLEHLPDTNYWHYTLQLNVYKWILEKYYGIEICELYILILHPNNSSYRRMRLNILEDEIEDMIEARRCAVEQGCKTAVIIPSYEEPIPHKKAKTLAEFPFKL
jgi:hypothetical protein